MKTNQSYNNHADAQGNGKNNAPESNSPMNAGQLLENLVQFTGTEHYYRFWYGIRYLTDGVKYLADAAGCYWLLDAIGSYQPQLASHKDRRLHDLQFWTLKVGGDHSAVLTCVADGNEPPAVTQQIKWTNFPLPEIDIWVQRSGEDMIALLPSEY
jgi:hypothetical protein